MVNKYSVDYHTSSSGLTSRIHPLTYNRPLSALSIFKIFVEFSLIKSAYSTMIEENFQIFKLMVFRLLENAFVSQKIKCRHFYSSPLTVFF